MTKSVRAQIDVPVARYTATPSWKVGQETELLYGEMVTILEEGPVFSKVQAETYRTPGYVKTKELSRNLTTRTHRVMKPLVNLYTYADFRSPVVFKLAMNSMLTFRESRETPEGTMHLFDDIGWLYAGQAALDTAVCATEYDYVDAVLAYVGLPYDWGGRMFPDCSGLVQQVLLPIVPNYPRNSRDQMAIGAEVEMGLETLKRGDLVFFMEGESRHVVVMVDDRNCVHASIASRCVIVESLASAVTAQKVYGTGEISAVRRFPWYRRR